MASLHDIKNEIQELSLLEVVTRAFSEIASLRMKTTRTSVLTNRDFLSDLASIFDEVRASYEREAMSVARAKGKGNKEKITFLSHNGKNVALLISANAGLYGSIVKETMDMFVRDIKDTDIELTVVGRQGQGYLNSTLPNRPYTYFDVPDEGIEPKHMSPLIRHIVKYDEIHVYFGRFQNVVQQVPTKLVISSHSNRDAEGGTSASHRSYRFEPSLAAVLEFFETEMFASLFEQSVRESSLAKYASRILSLDEASQRVGEEKAKLSLRHLSLIHREVNRKQLNSLSGILFHDTR